MTESPPVLDLAAALDRFDGDQELFLSLAGMFVERAEQTLLIIHAALTAEDFPCAKREAHKFKGSALEFCAHAAVAAASRLEAAIGQPIAADVVAIGARLEGEIQRLIAGLKDIRDNGFPS